MRKGARLHREAAFVVGNLDEFLNLFNLPRDGPLRRLGDDGKDEMRDEREMMRDDER